MRSRQLRGAHELPACICRSPRRTPGRITTNPQAGSSSAAPSYGTVHDQISILSTWRLRFASGLHECPPSCQLGGLSVLRWTSFWDGSIVGLAMDDISHLPAKERAKIYRKLATDARREAADTTDGIRESYLIIAAQFDH